MIVKRVMHSKTYFIAFTLMIAWAVLAYTLTNQIIAQQQHYGELINLSGKQRMLSQKTALSVCRYALNPQDKALLEQLRSLTKQLEDDNSYIQTQLPSAYLKNFYTKRDGLEDQHHKYTAQLQAYLSHPDISSVNQITTQSEALLPILNQAVQMLVKEHLTLQEKTKNRTFYSLIGTLLTLLLIYFIIIRPMNKRDEIYTSMLEQKVAERVRDLMIFSAIFDNSNEGMILTDDQEVIIKVNKAFTTITGYTMQEVVGLTPRVLQSGVQDIAFYQQMWHDIGEKGIWTGNIINKNSQGKHYSEYLTILKLYNEQTDTINYVSIFSDLSKLHETLDRFQKVIDLQSHLIIVTDGEQILFGNKQLYEFFGFNSLQVFLENHDCVCHSFIEDENYFSLAKVPKDMHWIDVISSLDEKDRVVLIYDKQSGTNRSFQISITHYDSNSYLIVFMDVSRNILENRKLQIKAQTDRLTGCYNREYLYSYFEDFTQKTFEHSRSVGIILYDIDKFKKINDTYGHNRGDYVLVHLCHLIQSKMRADDLLVRWGGEEFLIFLMTNSIEETTHIAQKLRAYVEKEEFEEIEHLTCSFGITLYNAGEKLETAIQRADEALYEAKAAGRNQVKFF